MRFDRIFEGILGLRELKEREEEGRRRERDKNFVFDRIWVRPYKNNEGERRRRKEKGCEHIAGKAFLFHLKSNWRGKMY